MVLKVEFGKNVGLLKFVGDIKIFVIYRSIFYMKWLMIFSLECI